MSAIKRIFFMNGVYIRRKFRIFSAIKALCIRMILFYQKHISLHTCMFHPTCSQYTLESINNYGVFLGIGMGFCRILRCNPLAVKGTYDPVPEKRGKLKWIV